MNRNSSPSKTNVAMMGNGDPDAMMACIPSALAGEKGVGRFDSCPSY